MHYNDLDTAKYNVAKISENDLEKIQSLENKINQTNDKNIVLIAYEPTIK